MPFRGHLPHDDLTALHAAAVTLGLAPSRNALLDGIAPAYVGSLPTDASPSTQLSRDLEAMNQVDALADGTVPLRLWLSAAHRLTSSRRESAVFAQALAQLDAAAAAVPGPAPGEAEGRRTGPRFVVPFLRNPGFVGREEDLAEVHALLQEGRAVG